MKKCLKCGGYINQGHGYKSSQKYCSYKCYKDRNLPDKQELLYVLNRTDNINVTAQLFGVSKQALYAWMEKMDIKRTVLYG